MEQTPNPTQITLSNVTNHAHSAGDGLATEDDGGADDPPPIPSAGSSSHGLMPMKEKELDGARTPNTFDTLSTIATDVPAGEVQTWAHIAAIDLIADALQVDIKHVPTRTFIVKLANDNRAGLTPEEAAKRREQHGRNILETSGGVTWRDILVRQVSNSLTAVLAIAMILSYVTFDWIEGGVISAVICLNIVVGFWQDYRAEQSLQSLRAMAAPTCKVLRGNGVTDTIKAEDLVPGDIVLLSTGDIIPADLRLVSSVNLAVDEALLTGESKPSTKDAEHILDKADCPIGDRSNMMYSSTIVTRGRGTGIVTATRMKTEIGKIALLLREKGHTFSGSWATRTVKRVVYKTKSALGLIGTPSQVRLSYFGLLLFGLAIILALIVFSAAEWDLDDETLIYGICVAVAVIPESLIAVLTITMAVGTKAMARGGVIVRKMSALEAVGGVTNVCSDKTGTLTQGKMLARKAWLPDGRILKVENETGSFDPTSGQVTVEDRRILEQNIAGDYTLQQFFSTIALCNLAQVNPQETDPGNNRPWTTSGEPTEIALQVLAMRVGYGKTDITLRSNVSMLTEHSFDSAVKRMSVVYRTPGDKDHITCFVKGATEAVLSLTDINDTLRLQHITNQVEAMAKAGLRVLCLAYKTLDASDEHRVLDRGFVESNLTFAGLVGIYDPPRLESATAVKQCQDAGITVHMLTGDHLQTATTIAKEVGILPVSGGQQTAASAVMTAAEFDQMSDTELDRLEPLPLVLARCSPSTKLRMLDALHRRGKFCIMTGDGVNDSPALKGADVGVAMGLNGSGVSKEAADMVLTDDNFASIVSAIREGRRLFDNMQKFLLHLLISNIAQVILLLIGLAFKDADGVSVFPLSPLEILFANLVTSSFLAIGLGLEGPSADIMSRPPHSLKDGIFTKELIIDKFIYGSFMGSLCLASYVVVAFGVGNGDLGQDCNHNYNESCDIPYRARGTAYSILTCLLSVMAWECKHFKRSLFNMYPEEDGGRFSFFRTVRKNAFLFWAVCAGLETPFIAIYVPVVNRTVFRHKPLSWEWGLVAGSLVCFVALVESWKAVKRRRFRVNGAASEVEKLEV